MTERNDKWLLDAAGLLPAARFVPSPNCDTRPAACPVELVVIHNISLPPGCFGGHDIEAFFTNCLDPSADPFYSCIADTRVSAHFLIRRDGELVQFVSCNDRAWHAGVSRWRGREKCNDFSIGIELEGSDDIAFEEVQYDVLRKLVGALRHRHPILECVGHSDIAIPPGRKTDPGRFFDWARLDDSQSTV